VWCTLAALLLSATPALDLSTVGAGEALPELTWRSAPSLQRARVTVAAAVAEARRAQRLPNPGLDLGLNTLPVGPLNPPGLADPWLNVPNLQVSLSVLLELGKRGPRQEATAEAARAAALDALEALRQETLRLVELIGDVAAAQVRIATLEGLTADARHLAELQARRAERGDTSALDADRARLETEGTLTALGETTEQLSAALRACGELLATPCLPFGDVAHARAWLELRPARGSGAPAARPDVRALEASERAARATQRLAERQWLPDPTVRVGYVHDRFVVSGNQQNSLFVGLSTPLRLFDHGQDDAQAAAVAATAAARLRAQRVDAAALELERLQQEVDRVEARQARLRTEALPLAQSVEERLEQAVARGAATVQELLLARRTLAELTLTAVALDRTVFGLHVSRARLRATPLPSLPELEVSP
jgi:cobalt-zinc-cadmium efflux system outer membrane protein